MLTGLSTSATAMNAYQTSLDNTSNNLANVNTTAFKRSVVSFQDMMYTGGPGMQVGNSVKVASVAPLGFAQGALNSTGRDTDLAISGTGFFVVQLTDGSTAYTRDGSFSRDATGRLITASGNVLQPPITVPIDTVSLTVGADGTVTAITSSAPTVPKVLGQIQIASFPNQEGLTIESGNLYQQNVASGSPTTGTPGTNGLGEIQQGSLEQSNVDVTTELANLVSTQQAYIANSKAVNVSLQMLQSGTALIQ